jgi:hypothetical protein
VTGQTETLRVLVNDFTSNDTSGTPALFLNNQNAPQHSLRQYTSLSVDTISVQPGVQATVSATISIPAGAKAGGYFGAIRFAPVSGSNGKTVNLSGSVASLILVTVPGNYAEQLSVTSFNITQQGHLHSVFKTSKDLKAAATFKNSGDVQEQPFGKVQVQKGSKVIYSTEINNTDPRGNVLPGTSRTFNVNLSNIGSLGKYTVIGSFGYGNKGQLVNAKTTFYIIPLGAILAVIVALIVLVALLVIVPRIIRGHDDRILRRAGRR